MARSPSTSAPRQSTCATAGSANCMLYVSILGRTQAGVGGPGYPLGAPPRIALTGGRGRLAAHDRQLKMFVGKVAHSPRLFAQILNLGSTILKPPRWYKRPGISSM